MKFLVRSILIILCLWLVIDRMGGLCMKWVYQNTNDNKAKKINQIVKSVDADVVLIGTSRCAFHYVPSIISDSLGMSVYNAGLDASENIYSNYMVLSFILQHHTPKVVCLDTGESEYAMGTNDFDAINIFAPHYGVCPQVDSVFSMAGTSALYRLSHLYRYHSGATIILGSLLIPPTEDDCGFTPLPYRETNFDIEHIPVSKAREVDPKRISMFRRFINLCQERDIKLILSISPSMEQLDEHYYDVIRVIAAEYNLPLLDYDTNNYLCDHPEYFRDIAHMCGEGARVFSSAYAHDLKGIIQPIPERID